MYRNAKKELTTIRSLVKSVESYFITVLMPILDCNSFCKSLFCFISVASGCVVKSSKYCNIKPTRFSSKYKTSK